MKSDYNEIKEGRSLRLSVKNPSPARIMRLIEKKLSKKKLLPTARKIDSPRNKTAEGKPKDNNE